MCGCRPLTEEEKQDPKADEKAQAAQTAAVEAGLSQITVRVRLGRACLLCGMLSLESAPSQAVGEHQLCPDGGSAIQFSPPACMHA